MIKKIAYHFGMLSIGMALVLIVYLFYLTFYPFEIVTLNKFDVYGPVKAGEFLQYRLDFEKHRNIKPEIGYYLVDGIIIQLPGGSITRPTGEQRVFSSRQIPSQIPKGTYKLRIELVYEVVPWRKITYVWESQQFQIY